MVQEELFLSTLIQRGLIKQSEASSLLQEAQGLEKNVEELINERKLVDEKILAQLKGELFNLPIKQFLKMKLSLRVF